MATEQIGHLTMTAKQCGDQRSAARTVCFRVQGRTFSTSNDAISGWLAYAAAWSGVQPRSLASLTSAPAASKVAIGDSPPFQSALPAKLTARFSSVFPFVPRR